MSFTRRSVGKGRQRSGGRRGGHGRRTQLHSRLFTGQKELTENRGDARFVRAFRNTIQGFGSDPEKGQESGGVVQAGFNGDRRAAEKRRKPNALGLVSVFFL